MELLEGDGSVPYQWPIEMDDHDDAVFLAPPALYDVDGDGNQVNLERPPAFLLSLMLELRVVDETAVRETGQNPR